MFCKNCNKKWSSRVYPYHVARCIAPVEKILEEKNLDDMKVAELRAFADANEIEIPENVTKKANILEYLKMAT